MSLTEIRQIVHVQINHFWWTDYKPQHHPRMTLYWDVSKFWSSWKLLLPPAPIKVNIWTFSLKIFVPIIICYSHDNSSVLNRSTRWLFQTWSRVHMIVNFDTWNALTGKLWNCMGSWFNFLKQICLTVVEKVLNFQSYMNIQCVFTRNMAKLTCDSLLDLTSNANIVTGSPVP